MQAKQTFKHSKEMAEMNRYLTAPKLGREKTEVINMETKLKDKHNKENTDMQNLFKEKKDQFANKRKELDLLD